MLSFHNATRLVLHINFKTLQIAYVSFVDWDRVLGWLGRVVAPEPVTVVMPAGGTVRRVVAVVQVLDLFRRVDYAESSQAQHLEVTSGGRNASGADAWRLVLRRVPPAWPLLLIARWLPTNAGESRRDARRTGPSGSVRGVLAMGVLLFVAVAVAGVLGARSGWPFAQYPTFGGRLGNSTPALAMKATSCDGSVVMLDVQRIRRGLAIRGGGHYPSYRYAWLERRLLTLPQTQRQARYQGFVSGLLEPELDRAGQVPVADVSFYRTTVRLPVEASKPGSTQAIPTSKPLAVVAVTSC